MYSIENLTISTVIDDYQSAGNEKRPEILDAFMDKLQTTYPLDVQHMTVNVSFRIDSRIPKNLADILRPYSNIHYKHVNTKCASNDPYSILKQKLLNIYARRCDKEVSFQSSYHEAMRTPKKMYYRILRGIDISEDELRSELQNISGISEQRELDAAWKIDMTVPEFMLFVKNKLRSIFENYHPPGADAIPLESDFVDEDRYAISYIGRCMDYYAIAEVKHDLGLREHGIYKLCPKCRNGIVDISDHKYCIKCRKGSEIKRYATCNCCHKPFELNHLGRRTSFCESCRKKIHREQKRILAAKSRANKKK